MSLSLKGAHLGISDINTLQTWFRTRDVRCFIVLLFFEILGTLGLEYVRDMVL